MEISTIEFEIIGLIPYTNYTIHVRAIGEGNLLGDIEEELLQRTSSTTQNIFVNTTMPTLEPKSNTIHILLPDPGQVETGPVM